MSERPRSRRRDLVVLGAAFACLYALTWNGRVIHDGPFFLAAVEQGRWLHVHAAYLPLALSFAWIPGASPHVVLGTISVLSGAAIAVLSADLALRATGHRAASLTAAVLVAAAPVVWAAAGMVEIHVFAGAGATLGAWLACALPARPAVRVAVAIAVAMLAHMSGALMTPLFLVLAFGGTLRGWSTAERVLAPVAAVVTVLALRAFGQALPPDGALDTVVGDLLRNITGMLAEPRVYARRVADDYLRPWLLLSAAPFLALAFHPPRLRAAIVASAGLAALAAAATPGHPPMLGQYGLILAPGLALATAAVLARVPRRLVLAVAAVALVQLGASLAEWRRLCVDPHLVWAESVAPAIEQPAIVFCQGAPRQQRFEDVSGARGSDFTIAAILRDGEPEAAILRAVEGARTKGKNVYFDQRIFTHREAYPHARDVVEAVERLLELEPVGDLPLLRLRE